MVEAGNKIRWLAQARDASWENAHGDDSIIYFFPGVRTVVAVFDETTRTFKALLAFTSGNASGLSSPDWLIEQVGVESARVHAFAAGTKSMLVPESLYSADNEEGLFRLHHRLDDKEHLYFARVKGLDARLIYAVHDDFREGLDRLGVGASLNHHSLPWLEGVLSASREDKTPHLHFDICEGSMQVAAFIDGKLVLFNIYVCDKPEDVLYFLLFVSEQLSISPQRDAYRAGGLIEKGGELHLLLQKYIRHVTFHARPEPQQYSLPVRNLTEHLYFKAFSSPLCVL
ncbi:MAG: DUF3822 family protein [Bacteroidota bacterium]|nr:DUF3822 family protein [Bacteroidota bacterium]